MEVQKILQSLTFNVNQLQFVTVDGGIHMAEVRKAEMGQVRTTLKDLQLTGALFIDYYIIHQQALSGKYLDISCVLKPPSFPGLILNCVTCYSTQL